jgi:anti-sigma B factor antagonist
MPEASEGKPGHFRVVVLESAPVLVLGLRGDLDLSAMPVFVQDLEQAIAARGPDEPLRVVVDLSQCRFTDSSGLDVFLKLMLRAKQSGGKAVFACPSPRVQRVFELTQLSTILTIADSVEAAKARTYPSNG